MKQILRRTVQRKYFIPSIARLLSFIFIFTNIAFAHKPQENVWDERHHSQPVQLAALPANFPFPNHQIAPALPSAISSILGKDRPAGEKGSSLNATRLDPFSPKRSSADFPAEFLAQVNIKEARRIAGAPTVVVIEDVHQNLEAQTHISNAIKALGDVAGQEPIVVGLEAAHGGFVYELYHRFPRQDIAREIADQYLNSGEISGPAHAGYSWAPKNGSRGLRFWGVDDPALYNRNVAAYKNSSRLKKKTQEQIAALKKDLESKKASLFSPELKKFDALVAARRTGELSMPAFAKALAQENAEEVSFNLQQFLAAYDMETKMDFARVEAERSEVLERLVKEMNQSDLDGLVALSLGYQEGGITFAQYYEHLRDLCRRHNINLANSPNFDNYIRYVLLADGVKGEQLFREIDALEAQTFDSLATTDEQKTMIASSRQLYLAEQLCEFSLTTDQWESYQKGRGLLSLDLSAAEDFYRSADLRNVKMVENLLAQNGRSYILVAGGFHTAGLTALIRKNHFSYVVATPKLSKIDTESAGSAYLSVFDREKTPLEQIFSGDKLFLAGNLQGAMTPLSPEFYNSSVEQALDVVGETALRDNPAGTSVTADVAGLIIPGQQSIAAVVEGNAALITAKTPLGTTVGRRWNGVTTWRTRRNLLAATRRAARAVKAKAAMWGSVAASLMAAFGWFVRNLGPAMGILASENSGPGPDSAAMFLLGQGIGLQDIDDFIVSVNTYVLPGENPTSLQRAILDYEKNPSNLAALWTIVDHMRTVPEDESTEVAPAPQPVVTVEHGFTAGVLLEIVNKRWNGNYEAYLGDETDLNQPLDAFFLAYAGGKESKLVGLLPDGELKEAIKDLRRPMSDGQRKIAIAVVVGAVERVEQGLPAFDPAISGTGRKQAVSSEVGSAFGSASFEKKEPTAEELAAKAEAKLIRDREDAARVIEKQFREIQYGFPIQAAIDALENLGQPGLNVIHSFLWHPDIHVSAAALEVLGRVGDRKNAITLVQLLSAPAIPAAEKPFIAEALRDMRHRKIPVIIDEPEAITFYDAFSEARGQEDAISAGKRLFAMRNEFPRRAANGLVALDRSDTQGFHRGLKYLTVGLHERSLDSHPDVLREFIPAAAELALNLPQVRAAPTMPQKEAPNYESRMKEFELQLRDYEKDRAIERDLNNLLNNLSWLLYLKINGHPLKEVVEALARLAGRGGEIKLSHALGHPDPEINNLIIEKLKELDTESAKMSLRTSVAVPVEMGANKPATIEELRKIVDDSSKSPETRRLSLKALARQLGAALVALVIATFDFLQNHLFLPLLASSHQGMVPDPAKYASREASDFVSVITDRLRMLPDPRSYREPGPWLANALETLVIPNPAAVLEAGDRLLVRYPEKSSEWFRLTGALIKLTGRPALRSYFALQAANHLLDRLSPLPSSRADILLRKMAEDPEWLTFHAGSLINAVDWIRETEAHRQGMEDAISAGAFTTAFLHAVQKARERVLTYSKEPEWNMAMNHFVDRLLESRIDENNFPLPPGFSSVRQTEAAEELVRLSGYETLTGIDVRPLAQWVSGESQAQWALMDCIHRMTDRDFAHRLSVAFKSGVVSMNPYMRTVVSTLDGIAAPQGKPLGVEADDVIKEGDGAKKEITVGDGKKLLGKFGEFLKQEDGPTAVEYAVMLALIVVVCIAAIVGVDESVKKKIEDGDKKGDDKKDDAVGVEADDVIFWGNERVDPSSFILDVKKIKSAPRRESWRYWWRVAVISIVPAVLGCVTVATAVPFHATEGPWFLIVIGIMAALPVLGGIWWSSSLRVARHSEYVIIPANTETGYAVVDARLYPHEIEWASLQFNVVPGILYAIGLVFLPMVYYHHGFLAALGYFAALTALLFLVVWIWHEFFNWRRKKSKVGALGTEAANVIASGSPLARKLVQLLTFEAGTQFWIDEFGKKLLTATDDEIKDLNLFELIKKLESGDENEKDQALDALASSRLGEYITGGVTGQTSNQAIFEKGVNDGHYDQEIAALEGSNQSIYDRVYGAVTQLSAATFRFYRGTLDTVAAVAKYAFKVSHETSAVKAMSADPVNQVVAEAEKLTSYGLFRGEEDENNVLVKIASVAYKALKKGAAQQDPAARDAKTRDAAMQEIERIVTSKGIATNVTLGFGPHIYVVMVTGFLHGMSRYMDERIKELESDPRELNAYAIRRELKKDMDRMTGVFSYFSSRADVHKTFGLNNLIDLRISLLDKINDAEDIARLEQMRGKLGNALGKVTYDIFEAIFLPKAVDPMVESEWDVLFGADLVSRIQAAREMVEKIEYKTSLSNGTPNGQGTRPLLLFLFGSTGNKDEKNFSNGIYIFTVIGDYIVNTLPFSALQYLIKYLKEKGLYIVSTIKRVLPALMQNGGASIPKWEELATKPESELKAEEGISSYMVVAQANDLLKDLFARENFDRLDAKARESLQPMLDVAEERGRQVPTVLDMMDVIRDAGAVDFAKAETEAVATIGKRKIELDKVVVADGLAYLKNAVVRINDYDGPANDSQVILEALAVITKLDERHIYFTLAQIDALVRLFEEGKIQNRYIMKALVDLLAFLGTSAVEPWLPRLTRVVLAPEFRKNFPQAARAFEDYQLNDRWNDYSVETRYNVSLMLTEVDRRDQLPASLIDKAVAAARPTNQERSEGALRRKMKEAARLAGFSGVHELADAKKRAEAIDIYDAQEGGVEKMVKGRSKKDLRPNPVAIQTAASPDDEAEYLMSTLRGERAKLVSGGGAGSRAKLPEFFNRLGISGLTPRILKELQTRGYTDETKTPTLDEFKNFVQDAAEAKIESEDDISFIQRDLLQYCAQIVDMVARHPELGISAGQVLAGATFVVSVNPDNRDAIVAQLRAVKFPGKIFVLVQPELGGLTNPDEKGELRWDETHKFPEGHMVVLKNFARSPTGNFELRPDGSLDPVNEPLRARIARQGAKHIYFGQGNDLHFFEDMAAVTRWKAALGVMNAPGSTVKMVAEVVENTIGQPGGAVFKKPDSEDVEFRDSHTMNTPELKEYAVPSHISRMGSVIELAALENVDWDSLPNYLKDRKIGIIGLDAMSSDVSSDLPTRVMELKDFELNTFKIRSRIQPALDAIFRQNAQPSFQKLIQGLYEKPALPPELAKLTVADLINCGLALIRKTGGEMAEAAMIDRQAARGPRHTEGLSLMESILTGKSLALRNYLDNAGVAPLGLADFLISVAAGKADQQMVLALGGDLPRRLMELRGVQGAALNEKVAELLTFVSTHQDVELKPLVQPKPPSAATLTVRDLIEYSDAKAREQARGLGAVQQSEVQREDMNPLNLAMAAHIRGLMEDKQDVLRRARNDANLLATDLRTYLRRVASLGRNNPLAGALDPDLRNDIERMAGLDSAALEAAMHRVEIRLRGGPVVQPIFGHTAAFVEGDSVVVVDVPTGDELDRMKADASNIHFLYFNNEERSLTIYYKDESSYKWEFRRPMAAAQPAAAPAEPVAPAQTHYTEHTYPGTPSIDPELVKFFSADLYQSAESRDGKTEAVVEGDLIVLYDTQTREKLNQLNLPGKVAALWFTDEGFLEVSFESGGQIGWYVKRPAEWKEIHPGIHLLQDPDTMAEKPVVDPLEVEPKTDATIVVPGPEKNLPTYDDPLDYVVATFRDGTPAEAAGMLRNVTEFGAIDRARVGVALAKNPDLVISLENKIENVEDPEVPGKALELFTILEALVALGTPSIPTTKTAKSEAPKMTVPPVFQEYGGQLFFEKASLPEIARFFVKDVAEEPIFNRRGVGGYLIQNPELMRLIERRLADDVIAKGAVLGVIAGCMDEYQEIYGDLPAQDFDNDVLSEGPEPTIGTLMDYSLPKLPASRQEYVARHRNENPFAGRNLVTFLRETAERNDESPLVDSLDADTQKEIYFLRRLSGEVRELAIEKFVAKVSGKATEIDPAPAPAFIRTFIADAEPTLTVSQWFAMVPPTERLLKVALDNAAQAAPHESIAAFLVRYLVYGHVTSAFIEDLLGPDLAKAVEALRPQIPLALTLYRVWVPFEAALTNIALQIEQNAKAAEEAAKKEVMDLAKQALGLVLGQMLESVSDVREAFGDHVEIPATVQTRIDEGQALMKKLEAQDTAPLPENRPRPMEDDIALVREKALRVHEDSTQRQPHPDRDDVLAALQRLGHQTAEFTPTQAKAVVAILLNAKELQHRGVMVGLVHIVTHLDPAKIGDDAALLAAAVLEPKVRNSYAQYITTPVLEYIDESWDKLPSMAKTHFPSLTYAQDDLIPGSYPALETVLASLAKKADPAAAMVDQVLTAAAKKGDLEQFLPADVRERLDALKEKSAVAEPAAPKKAKREKGEKKEEPMAPVDKILRTFTVKDWIEAVQRNEMDGYFVPMMTGDDWNKTVLEYLWSSLIPNDDQYGDMQSRLGPWYEKLKPLSDQLAKVGFRVGVGDEVGWANVKNGVERLTLEIYDDVMKGAPVAAESPEEVSKKLDNLLAEPLIQRTLAVVRKQKEEKGYTLADWIEARKLAGKPLTEPVIHRLTYATPSGLQLTIRDFLWEYATRGSLGHEIKSMVGDATFQKLEALHVKAPSLLASYSAVQLKSGVNEIIREIEDEVQNQLAKKATSVAPTTKVADTTPAKPSEQPTEEDLFAIVNKGTPDWVRDVRVVDMREKGAHDIVLTREMLDDYDAVKNPKGLGLRKWLANYVKEARVSTAGIRGRQNVLGKLNVLLAQDPRVPINLIGMALATEGKARVATKRYPGKPLHKLAASEVRYNSQLYVELIARIQAAHQITTHVVPGYKSMPIWMASFLIFKWKLLGGEYVTSSHADSQKSATKDLQNQGGQYVPEESMAFIEEVEAMFRDIEEKGEIRISMAATDDHFIDTKLLEHYENGIGMYVDYLRAGIATAFNLDLIRFVKNKIVIELVGGSMYRAMSGIFYRLGISDSFKFLHPEEDPYFHSVGKQWALNKTKDGWDFQDLSADTTITKVDETGRIRLPVMETMNYGKLLANEPIGTPIFTTDPDGDRIVAAQIEPANRASVLDKLGVATLDLGNDRILAVYMPNQGFLMKMDFQMRALKAAGLWTNGPRESGQVRRGFRFMIKTTASAASWDEWADYNFIPVINVPVGFKEIAAMMQKIEVQMAQNPEAPVIVTDVFGNKIDLGVQPRLLAAAEESGGIIFGPQELIEGHGGRSAIAMREKSAGEALVIASAMFAHLESEGRLLSDYLEEVFTVNKIVRTQDYRHDMVYYNESEPDINKLLAAKEAGEKIRTANDVFFLSIALAVRDGKIDLAQAKNILYETFPTLHFGNLDGISFVGDGTYLRFTDKFVEIRPSGTDAKTKGYAAGADKKEAIRYAIALASYNGLRTPLHRAFIPDADYAVAKERSLEIYDKFRLNEAPPPSFEQESDDSYLRPWESQADGINPGDKGAGFGDKDFSTFDNDYAIRSGISRAAKSDPLSRFITTEISDHLAFLARATIAMPKDAVKDEAEFKEFHFSGLKNLRDLSPEARNALKELQERLGQPRIMSSLNDVIRDANLLFVPTDHGYFERGGRFAAGLYRAGRGHSVGTIFHPVNEAYGIVSEVAELPGISLAEAVHLLFVLNNMTHYSEATIHEIAVAYHRTYSERVLHDADALDHNFQARRAQMVKYNKVTPKFNLANAAEEIRIYNEAHARIKRAEQDDYQYEDYSISPDEQKERRGFWNTVIGNQPGVLGIALTYSGAKYLYEGATRLTAGKLAIDWRANRNEGWVRHETPQTAARHALIILSGPFAALALGGSILVSGVVLALVHFNSVWTIVAIVTLSAAVSSPYISIFAGNLLFTSNPRARRQQLGRLFKGREDAVNTRADVISHIEKLLYQAGGKPLSPALQRQIIRLAAPNIEAVIGKMPSEHQAKLLGRISRELSAVPSRRENFAARFNAIGFLIGAMEIVAENPALAFSQLAAAVKKSDEIPTDGVSVVDVDEMSDLKNLSAFADTTDGVVVAVRGMDAGEITKLQSAAEKELQKIHARGAATVIANDDNFDGLIDVGSELLGKVSAQRVPSVARALKGEGRIRLVTGSAESVFTATDERILRNLEIIQRIGGLWVIFAPGHASEILKAAEMAKEMA